MSKQPATHNSHDHSAAVSRRSLLKAGTAAVIAPALPHISSHSSASAQDDRQISLIFDKPSTLNPLFSAKSSEQAAARLMMGSLVKLNDAFEAVPDLAETVEVSPDATVYTFTLRPDIVFNDGTPMTTADVQFTFERAVDERTGSIWRGRLLAIAGAEEYGSGAADSISGLEIVDDRTLRMTLVQPDATWLLVLCNFVGLGMLPAHVLQDVSPDQLAADEYSLAPTVGAGAFDFVELATDQYLELARNETSHPDGQIDRIFFRILAPEVGIVALENGELDVMGVPAEEVERLREIEHLEVISMPNPGIHRIVPNLSRPHFQDKRVRQAIVHAIDRQAITESVLTGQTEIVNSPIIGPDWMGTPEGLNEYPFDPDKARQLLEEAGWDSSQNFDILLQQAGNRITEVYAAIIQQQLADVGINLNIVPLETPEFTRRYVQEPDFDIAFNEGGLFRSDPNFSANFFRSTSFTPDGANFAHYANPEVDELFDAGKGTSDFNERRIIYTQLAQILNDDLPWIFLWSASANLAYNRRVVGIKPPTGGHMTWNLEDWSLAE